MPAISPSRRLAGLKRVVAAAALLLLAAASVLYAKAEYIVLGAEAYLYGYPLVVVDVTRATAALQTGPENHLIKLRELPDATFKKVVRPNVDTLYTSALIDMAQGPWVFEMTANHQRYEVMTFLDGWTNVFAAPGTRTTGSAGGRFLLVGPRWTGQLPDGLSLLRSPTRMVWLIGRTQTNGAADYPLVHRLQDGIRLRTLADWQAGQDPPAPAWQAATPSPRPAIEQMQAMGVDDFFTRLAQLLVDNPPAAADAPMLAKLQRIGVAPGQPPAWNTLQRWAVGLGRWIADRKVAQVLKSIAPVQGWRTPPSLLGNYGTSYNLRAAVAMVGLGANLPADAMYPFADVDANGRALSGSHRYRLHFKAGELPPVNAFWSVSAYGADDFFIANPLHRYALGDRDPLVLNPDGSLDLLIQAQAPAQHMRNNWLPVRAGEPFVLNARLYWPKPAALDGRWRMPALERLD